MLNRERQRRDRRRIEDNGDREVSRYWIEKKASHPDRATYGSMYGNTKTGAQKPCPGGGMLITESTVSRCRRSSSDVEKQRFS